MEKEVPAQQNDKQTPSVNSIMATMMGEHAIGGITFTVQKPIEPRDKKGFTRVVNWKGQGRGNWGKVERARSTNIRSFSVIVRVSSGHSHLCLHLVL